MSAMGSAADLIPCLCREGQLEIAVQAARKRRPDLSDDGLLALAREINGLSGMMSITECGIARPGLSSAPQIET